jgi:hypothetical protein
MEPSQDIPKEAIGLAATKGRHDILKLLAGQAR